MVQIAKEKGNRGKNIIVWGVILILGILSALSVYSFLNASNKTLTVLVAAADIPPYTKITAGSGQLKEVSIQEDTYKTLSQGQDIIYRKESDVNGFFTEVPIKAGEMIYHSKVSSPEKGRYLAQIYERPGWKLVTLSVSALNAAGSQLVAGDFIDLYYKDPSSEQIVLDPNLKNIRIMDIKYGMNYFKTNESAPQATQPEGVDPLAEAETSSPAAPVQNNNSLGNIDISLGENAVIILSIPEKKAAIFADLVLNSKPMYIIGTKPPIFTAIKEGETEGKEILVADFELNLTNMINSINESEEDLLLNNNNVYIIPSQPLLETVSPTQQPESENENNSESNDEQTENNVQENNAIRITSFSGNYQNIQFQFNELPISMEQFIAEYLRLGKNYKISFTYTDSANTPHIKSITHLKLTTE